MTQFESTDSNRLMQVDSEPNLIPIPVSRWESLGYVYPTTHGWYNMLRPENLRHELVDAGVVSCVNSRWLIFPDKWQLYCAANHRPRIG
jgi:hypothetical protein